MNRPSRSCTFGFITCRKCVIIVLMFVLLEIIGSRADSDYPKVTSPETEVQHYPAGNFINLQCAPNSCRKIAFKWEFKACSSNLLTDPATCIFDTEWQPILDTYSPKQCSLIIANSTSKHNGFYRCTKIASKNNETRVLKMYRVHVIERLNIENGKKPDIVDVQPVNSTIIQDSKLVVQCKVYSHSVPPAIRWLKQLDYSAADEGLVHHFNTNNNITYLNLNSSQIGLKNNTYISKLIIEKSSYKDSGVYTCLALNNFGGSSKDIFIEVIVPIKNRQENTSFCVLFLIPILFAAIPLTVWACVYFYRKKKMKNKNLDIRMCSDFYKYEPVLNRCVNVQIISRYNSQRVI